GLQARSAFDRAHLHPRQPASRERRARAEVEARVEVRLPGDAEDLRVRGRPDARALPGPREDLRGDREVLAKGRRGLPPARRTGGRVAADGARRALLAPDAARRDLRDARSEPRGSRALADDADEHARP